MAEPIPPRPGDALSGTRIMETVQSMLGDVQSISKEELVRRRARVERFFLEQVEAGNVPDFMRPENWREVSVETTAGGRRIEATVRVCPDYLAIGSNSDFVRIPLNPLTAQRIADRFGLSLPTPRLVDVIDTEAKRTSSTDKDGKPHTGMIPFIAAPSVARRVTDPSTGRPASERWNNQRYGNYEGRWMLSAEFMREQSRMIDEAVASAGNPPFRSGHRKDVVYDPLALQRAGEGGKPVVIYRPGIQPLSNIHNELYSDYSHGIRFLDSSVRLRITEADGRRSEERMSMQAVLNHQDYYRLFAPARMDISQMYRASEASRAVPRRRDRETRSSPQTY